MKERQNTKEPSLLDRILTDIFERELAAFSEDKPEAKFADKPEVKKANPKAEKQKSLDKVIASGGVAGLDKIELTEPVSEPAIMEETAETEETETMSSFTDPEDDPYAESEIDNWSYEVPRPWLSLKEAASMLGRSERALERSILGRWGNRLPEGWTARKVKIDGQEEWRIIPPPGFRVKHSRHHGNARVGKPETETETEEWTDNDGEGPENLDDAPFFYDVEDVPESKTVRKVEERQVAQSRDFVEPGTFSLEKLLQSATKLAQKELSALALPATRSRKERKDSDEHTTIVIDRSDEVERLLRELADCQKELAQERRQHMEDMRLMHEMQNSMRLLEVRAVETRELKDDLVLAQQALVQHRTQYQEFLALPWWKRLFHKN